MKNFVAGFLAIGAMLPDSRLPLFMLKCPLRPHPP